VLEVCGVLRGLLIGALKLYVALNLSFSSIKLQNVGSCNAKQTSGCISLPLALSFNTVSGRFR